MANPLHSETKKVNTDCHATVCLHGQSPARRRRRQRTDKHRHPDNRNNKHRENHPPPVRPVGRNRELPEGNKPQARGTDINLPRPGRIVLSPRDIQTRSRSIGSRTSCRSTSHHTPCESHRGPPKESCLPNFRMVARPGRETTIPRSKENHWIESFTATR